MYDAMVNSKDLSFIYVVFYFVRRRLVSFFLRNVGFFKICEPKLNLSFTKIYMSINKDYYTKNKSKH